MEVLHPKTISHDPLFKTALTGKIFVDIERVGKLLIFKFADEPELHLLAHLKMTGQFFFVYEAGRLAGGGGHSMSAADTASLPGRHTRVVFHLNDGSTLYFNDMRLFGYLKLADQKAVALAKSRFGQEPISADFNLPAFQEILKKRKRSIKSVLLDQSLIAGLGNIYVDEALFQAGVLPTRLANLLTEKEVELLARAAGEVTNEAIKNGGTTFQNFADTAGEAGGHSKHLKVFARNGQPCLTCGTTIMKTKVAGRGTHYCPKCQK